MVKPTNLSQEELEKRYRDVTALYDLAEELVSTVESELISNPNAQMDLVEPLVEQLGDSTDILSEEFIHAAETKPGQPSKANRGKVETALRKVYLAIEDYKKRIGVDPAKPVEKIINIADPIVEKIKRHLEKVLTVFLEMIDLSLDRIMHKHEIEELKKREEKIASLLHNISQQQPPQ